MNYIKRTYCMPIQYRNKPSERRDNLLSSLLASGLSGMATENKRLELVHLFNSLKAEEQGRSEKVSKGVVVNQSRVVVINAETLYLDGAAINRLLDDKVD